MRGSHYTLAAALLAGLLAACGVTDVENPSPVGFEGSFHPDSPEALISGSAAALTQFGTTDISLSADGLEADTTVPWLLREGDCGGDGEPFASPDVLPPLETDGEGSGAAEVAVNGSLNPEGNYVVELFEALPSRNGARVACAELSRTV